MTQAITEFDPATNHIESRAAIFRAGGEPVVVQLHAIGGSCRHRAVNVALHRNLFHTVCTISPRRVAVYCLPSCCITCIAVPKLVWVI